MLQSLSQYGVAVLSNVLSVEQCNEAYAKVWQFYETLSGNAIQFNQLDTWQHYYDYLPKHAMLQQHFGIGHSQAAWDIRQHPQVVNVYAQMYQCQSEDLLASFDGVSLHLAPEVTGRGWYNKDWLHVDQSYTNSGFQCVQSYVNLLDANSDDGTITVLLGSHNLHDEVRERFNITDSARFYQLTDDMLQYYLSRGCTYHRIAAPAGAMVLWDSRTVHCGSEPVKGRLRPTMRCVVYVCYMPRTNATDKQLEKKRQALQELRMTSHWPLESLLVSSHPHTYGKPLPSYPSVAPPQLTTLGWRLAGY